MPFIGRWPLAGRPAFTGRAGFIERDAFIERDPFVGRMPWRTEMPAERRRMGSARIERSGSKPATVSLGIRVLRSPSISRRSGASSTHTREIASPSTPARPVRPMRWT